MVDSRPDPMVPERSDDLTAKRLKWMRWIKWFWVFAAIVNVGLFVVDVVAWGWDGVAFGLPLTIVVPITGALIWVCDTYIVKPSI